MYMNYNEFKTKLNDDLDNKLNNEFDISFNKIYKINESYDAMTISKDNIGVNINLNKQYRMYLDNSYDYAYQSAIHIIEEGFRNKPNIDMKELYDYNVMKNKLFIEIISIKSNIDLLESVPYKQIEDMAIVYRFLLNNDNGRASILITNQILHTLNIDENTLHNDAIKNAQIINPMIINDLSEVLSEMMNEDYSTKERIFIASVADKIHGACVIAYKGFMEQASLKAGGDFYLLPSSIHEVLIVPDNGHFRLEDLQVMVKEVNENEVDEIDQLTDSVYHYDHKEQLFELGEKYLQRLNT